MVAVGFNPRAKNPHLSVRRVATIDIMANTFTSLHYHIVFSTKNRVIWIKADVNQRIWAYLGGIAKQNKMKPLQIGGTEEHVHVLLGAPAVMAPAKIAQLLKGGSSGWIQETFPRMNGFGWQDGYSAFTVSTSKCAVGNCLHSRAARASPHQRLPRGISRIAHAARNRI